MAEENGKEASPSSARASLGALLGRKKLSDVLLKCEDLGGGRRRGGVVLAAYIYKNTLQVVICILIRCNSLSQTAMDVSAQLEPPL